jgi:hypothetical protein
MDMSSSMFPGLFLTDWCMEFAELFVQSLHCHSLALATYNSIRPAYIRRCPRTGHVMKNPDNVTLVLAHRICSPIELLTRYSSTTLELGDKRELSSKS